MIVFAALLVLIGVLIINRWGVPYIVWKLTRKANGADRLGAVLINVGVWTIAFLAVKWIWVHA
jgi:hypothetical protein